MSDTMTVGEALIATVDQAAADVRLAREKSDATLSAGVNGLTIAQQLAIQKSLSETTVGMTLLSTGVKTVENTVEQVTKGG